MGQDQEFCIAKSLFDGKPESRNKDSRIQKKKYQESRKNDDNTTLVNVFFDSIYKFPLYLSTNFDFDSTNFSET